MKSDGKNMKLDKKNMKILAELDMNARIPIPELAKKVGVSRQVAEYRVKKMRDQGIITSSIAVYDQKIAGKNIYRVLFQLYNASNDEINLFVEDLRNNYKIMWFGKIGGGWDFVLNFIAQDIYEFDQIFMKITERYHELIQNYIILTYVNIHDFPRGYLGKNEGCFFHKMGHGMISLDEKDKQIVASLGSNCRQSNLEIGRDIGLSGNAVRYRIDRFKKEGFLLGFRNIVNPMAIEHQLYICFLDINNLDSKSEKKLVMWLGDHPNITFVVKHIGIFRIGFEIETRAVADLEQTIRDLRTTFRDLISDVKIFPVLKEFVVNYVP